MPKAKKLDPLQNPGLGETLADTREALTGGSPAIVSDADLPAAPVDNLTQFNRKKEIESKNSFGDYLGAIDREDGFIQRGIGHLVGHTEFDPDPTWRPFKEENWKDLSQGVPEELLDEFRKSVGNSVNGAHAQYIKGMVMEKVQDQELLSTLDTAGNVGRFAYGFVSPEQLALGVATMGVSKVASTVRGVATLSKAGEVAQRASKIADPALRAEQMGKAALMVEEAAKAGSGLRGAAAGFTTAAVGGAGFEALRQSVNFENDSDKILDATLYSVAFAAPFVGLGVSHMNKLTRTAAMERDVLGIMQRMHKGEVLSEAEFGKLKEYGYFIEKIKNEELGVYDTTKAFDEIKQRYELNDTIRDKWMRSQEEKLKENDGIKIGDEHKETIEPPKDPTTEPTKDEGTVTGEGTKTRAPRKKDVVTQGWDPAKDGKLNLPGNAWADKLVDAVKSGRAVQVKAKTVLTDLHTRFSGTVYEPIIKSLLKHPELRTKVHLSTDKNPSAAGLYWGHGKDVMVTYVKDLNNLSDHEARTFVHEMVHAHTVYALEGKIPLTPEQMKAKSALETLWRNTEKHFRDQDGIRKVRGKYNSHYSGKYYGFTDVTEFVSEVFSNREFQKLLEQVPVGKQETMLSKVWAGIKKILGVGKSLDDTAFRYAIGYTEQLIGSRIQSPGKASPFMKFDGGEMGGPHGAFDNTLPMDTPVPTGPSVMGFVNIGGKKVPIRWDIAQTFDNNLNPHIRQLGFDMVKNAIGWEGDRAQGITISERKERIRRVVAGESHYTMRDALNEAIKARGINLYDRIRSGFDKNFYELTTRLARGDQEVLIDNPDLAPHLKKSAAAMRKYFDVMGDRAMKSGLVGAENLPIGQNYVNRVYLFDKIRELAKTHGDEAVWGMFANAFNNTKIRGDMKVARNFVEAIQALEYKTNMSDLLLNAKDMTTLRKTLEDHGLNDGKIDAIINVMFDAKDVGDSGMPSNLRYRMDLDENASFTTPTGQVIKIADVLENDARLLIDKYTSTMGGYIAFAEHGWIDPKSEFARRIREADNWVGENSTGYDMNKYVADKQLAQDMFDHISGRPMSTQSFSRFDRFMGAMRAYSRSVFLGQLGIAAASELKNAMALSAFHGAWSQMPNFAKLITMVRKGIPVDDQLAKDIQHIAGFGNEFAMQYGRQHQITDHTYGRGISQFEKFSDKASHVVDVISGNSTFTSATRNLAAKFVTQHLYDIGAGKKDLDPGLTQRLVHNGIDKDNIKTTLADLNKYSVVDERGVVKSIDWENWKQENSKTYGDFTLAMERFSRDGIQDHNIGETMPWMHTTTGKIIAELKTFNLVAHAKQFLKNVHYQDRTSAMVFMTSFVGEAMTYSLQTAMNYAHNKDELDKRLTPERISKAAIQRMAALGVLSYVIDTPHKYVTGKSFFGEGTTNTDNRDLFMTPSLMLMKRMVGGTQTAFQAMSPVADSVTTKQEMKEALGVLPGVNTWGARNIVDFVSSHYPKSDPSQYQR